MTRLHLGLVQHYQEKHEENVAGGYVGIIIGLIKALQNNQKNFANAVKQLRDQDGKKLVEQVQREVDRLKKLELENKEIYNCEIPAE